MISKIKVDCIDLMVDDFNELEKFIIIMEKIIRKYDLCEESYFLYEDHWDIGTTTRGNLRMCVRQDTICDVSTCVYKINGVEIKFNINMRHRLNDHEPYLGF